MLIVQRFARVEPNHDLDAFKRAAIRLLRGSMCLRVTRGSESCHRGGEDGLKTSLSFACQPLFHLLFFVLEFLRYFLLTRIGRFINGRHEVDGGRKKQEEMLAVRATYLLCSISLQTLVPIVLLIKAFLTTNYPNFKKVHVN